MASFRLGRAAWLAATTVPIVVLVRDNVLSFHRVGDNSMRPALQGPQQQPTQTAQEGTETATGGSGGGGGGKRDTVALHCVVGALHAVVPDWKRRSGWSIISLMTEE